MSVSRLFSTVSLLLLYWESFCNGFRATLQQKLPQTRRKKSWPRPLFMSIPTPLDTLTSGVASILRLPGGVTVDPSKNIDINNKNNIRLLRLYDIENSVPCRSVREKITEYDINVQLVIPAASNSRSVNDPSYEYCLPQSDEAGGKNEVPILVARTGTTDNDIIRVVGEANILAFLAQSFGSSSSADVGVENALLNAVRLAGSYLAGLLRMGRGSQVSSCVTCSSEVNRPEKPLILYSYEGNQFCRLVREVLTELDIVYELRSAGKESQRRAELASITGGSSQCPYLIDPNTGVSMPESKDIIRYLYQTYGLWTPPSEILEWTSNNVMVLLKPIFSVLAPLQAGSDDKDGVYQEKIQATIRDIKAETTGNSVVVYTYELSPFSSETKALLDSLGVQYREISLGKEWIPGLISPEGSNKRAALLEMTGQSSLPHIFVGGKAIGGLFSGPGLLAGLEQGVLMEMLKEARTAKSNVFE